VFDRLYEDQLYREDRQQGLKAHLEKLDEIHWEEILQVLDFYKKDTKELKTPQF